jgi:ubiquitin C-terminal hydrolase
LTQFFTGTFMKKLHCKNCHKTTIIFEDFTDIYIPTSVIESNKQTLYIEQLLNSFFTEEFYENTEFPCSNCGKDSVAYITTRIIRLPYILAVTIGRGDLMNMTKDKRKLCFAASTRTVDMSQYSTSSSAYGLYGTINHKGHIQSGHYFA